MLEPVCFIGKMVHSMVAHLDAVTSLAVDPNGLYLLSGSKYHYNQTVVSNFGVLQAPRLDVDFPVFYGHYFPTVFHFSLVFFFFFSNYFA